MKFKYTILYVKSLLETLEFYKNAFGFEAKMISPDEGYAELETGDTTLSFAQIDSLKEEFSTLHLDIAKNISHSFEIAFTTKDIEKDFNKALENGAELVESIKEQPWGQKVGYVKDINGFLIEICTPIE